MPLILQRVRFDASIARSWVQFALIITLAGCADGSTAPIATEPPDTYLPARFICGVNHAHIHRRGHGYGSDRSQAELTTLRILGVNAIALTPFGYQDGATADGIRGYPGRPGPSEFFAANDDTMKDTDLIMEMNHARALGMSVAMKPQIWSRDFWDGREWHGTILQKTPEEHARWWESYREFSLHYARVAIQGRATIYCVGTELVEMSTKYPDEWRGLIHDIRALPGGETLQLTYSAHWDRELDAISFWDALDFIGLGAYYPLDAPFGASVEALEKAWTPHRQRLATLHKRWGKPVLFLEAGYRAVAGNHQRPWEYSGGDPDSAAQARSYEALFRALHAEAWWAGVYFWKTFTDPDLASVRGDAPQFGFRNRPAETVVSKWFRSSRNADVNR